MALKVLLLDLDGTLIDSRHDLTDAVNAALRAVDQPERSEAEVVPHVGNGLRVLLKEVLGPVSDEALAKAMAAFSEYYGRHCVDKTVLYPDVLDVLRDIHTHVQLGVVTNKPHRFADQILTKLGLGDIVSTIIGGDSIAERKPHPAPVLKAIYNLGSTPEQALMVGDGTQDIQAGQSAGVLTGLVRYGFGFRTEALDLKPDFVLSRFREIKEIVL